MLKFLCFANDEISPVNSKQSGIWPFPLETKTEKKFVKTEYIIELYDVWCKRPCKKTGAMGKKSTLSISDTF